MKPTTFQEAFIPQRDVSPISHSSRKTVKGEVYLIPVRISLKGDDESRYLLANY